jgi:hypothetical protein
MTVKMLESVVLRGVRVKPDVRMVLERIGSNLNGLEPQAVSLSFARHLFPSDPQADADAGTRGKTATPVVGAPRIGPVGPEAPLVSSVSARREPPGGWSWASRSR